MPTNIATTQTYIDYVEQLASTGEDELFFNSGPIHAAIVMSRVFKYSTEVKMLCGGFDGAVSNDEEYLKYLELFFMKGGQLTAFVEKDLTNSQNKIFKVLRKHKDQVKLYLTNSTVKLSNDGNAKRVHFAVGNEKILRIETNVDDYTAQVNFGSQRQADVFLSVFNNLMEDKDKKELALA